MTEPVVLVARREIGEELAGLVMAACGRARLRAVPWSRGETPPSCRPVLLVAPLAARLRQIPDALVDYVTRAHPGLPLLLLCNEPLARPTMSLNEGRVTLLGLPASQARIYSAIRVLTSAARGEVVSSDAGVVAREHASPAVWSAEFARAATGRAPTLPFVDDDGDGAVLAVVSYAADAAVGADEIARVREAVRSAADDGARESVLRDALGTRAGVIHLSPTTKQWLVYWPSETRPLWMFSPLRLPSLWNLAAARRAGDSHVARIAASSGDVALAMSAPIAPATDRGSESGGALCLPDGGPALLDQVAARVGAASNDVFGFLAEVR